MDDTEKTLVDNWKCELAKQPMAFEVYQEEDKFVAYARLQATDYLWFHPYDEQPNRLAVQDSVMKSPDFRRRAGLEQIS